ncbi:nuclear transport factor 2 family protein [Actinomyces faecalis]|nr:nuclear transport factor 2 family protein [Actinomyces faecalis]
MTGVVQSREELLMRVREEDVRYFSSTEESVSCDIDGDTAVMTGRSAVDARIYGTRASWPLQLVFQAGRRPHGWVLTSAQASTY